MLALAVWAVASPVYDHVLAFVAAIAYPIVGSVINLEQVSLESGSLIARAYSDTLASDVLVGVRLSQIHYNEPILIAFIVFCARTTREFTWKVVAALTANAIFHLTYAAVMLSYQLTVLEPHVMLLPDGWQEANFTTARILANSLAHQAIAVVIGACLIAGKERQA